MTPLILAIESDYRQAAHLRSIIKHRVGAELVLADTTERALDALGFRVPDLVLVPALLSPQDDAAIAQALRVIASAAHVQMLTIPLLAAPAPASALPKGGVLSALLRDRPRAVSTEGCDPAVFAEQIRSYLEQRAREHEERLDDFEESAPIHEDVPEIPQPVEEPVATEPLVAAAPPEPEPEFEPLVEPLPSPVFAEEPPPTAFANLLHLFREPEPPAPAPVAPATAESVDIAAIDELIAELAASELPRIEEVRAETWPQEADTAPAALIEEEEEEEIVLDLDEPAQPEPTAAPSTTSPEWVALIASLRQDMERRRTDPTPRPAQPRRRGRPAPVQDEWGFFDPEQCGFAALLAKLEEITQ